MITFFLALSFVIGALMGSFITALVWRTRHQRSMMEQHSICPECKHPLGPLDLVPILSYLLQRGRCRYCGAVISWQYPAIEVSTALLFVATAWNIVRVSGLGFETFAILNEPWVLVSIIFSWVMVVLLVALCIYDLRWGELPNHWTLGGAGLALAVSVLAVMLHRPMLWQPVEASLVEAVLAGLMAAGFFLAIVYGSEKILKKPGMGIGDVKLALLMGLFLGFPGILVALYLAFILGAVLSLVLITAKRKQMGATIPFGPFMVAGTFLAWWFTPTVVAWYQQLLT